MKRTQRGSAMVLTMAVLAALTALVASFAATESAEFRARTNRIEQQRAAVIAESGLQRALAELAQPAQSAGATSPQDAWAQLGDHGNQSLLIDGGSFRVEVLDACSLVNINTAPEQQLLNLPLTTEQIDSLLDWRSNDNTPRPEGGRDEYYNALIEPYNASLAPIETIDELLLIKGFSGPTLYQQPTDQVNTQFLAAMSQQEPFVLAQLITVNSTAPELGTSGAAKGNISTVTTAALVQLGFPQQMATAIFQGRGGFQRLGDVFRIPGMNAQYASIILDNYRFGTGATSNGKINLNTASEAVLNSIPGFTPDVSQAILAQQGTGMTGLGEFANIPGVTMQLLQQCADLVTVASQTYLVRVLGRSGGVSVPIEALVSVQNGTVRILQENKPPIADPRTLWRWATDATSDIDLRTGL